MNVFSALEKDEIDRLLRLADKYLKTCSLDNKKERREIADWLLGFDVATIEFNFDDEQITGVTRWIDNRYNKAYSLETQIRIVEWRNLNFRRYLFISTINGKEFLRSASRTNIPKDLVNFHKRHGNIFFNRARKSFYHDLEVDLEDIATKKII